MRINSFLGGVFGSVRRHSFPLLCLGWVCFWVEGPLVYLGRFGPIQGYRYPKGYNTVKCEDYVYVVHLNCPGQVLTLYSVTCVVEVPMADNLRRLPCEVLWSVVP